MVSIHPRTCSRIGEARTFMINNMFRKVICSFFFLNQEKMQSCGISVKTPENIAGVLASRIGEG